MSMYDFAQGVSSWGIPLIGSGPVLTSGKVFFVHGTTGRDVSDQGYSPLSPVATIDYAVGKCTANKGDVILVMPGHTETVSAAAGLALDVAGIRVIGLGYGTDRATVNFTTAVGADMNVDAQNIQIENILFTGGIDNLTAPIDVNAADFRMYNCECRDVTGQAALWVLTDANATRMHIREFKHFGDTSNAGCNSAIKIVGGSNILIEDFYLEANYTNAAIDVATTATTKLRVRNGHIRTYNAADLCIKDTVTGSTGQMGPNLFLMLNDNEANITEAITGATFVVFDPVYVCNLQGEKAMLINWTASTDA